MNKQRIKEITEQFFPYPKLGNGCCEKAIEQALLEYRDEIVDRIRLMATKEIFSDLDLCPYTVDEIATKIKNTEIK